MPATPLDTLRVEVEADTRNLRRGLNIATRQTRTAGRRMERSFDGVGNSVRDLQANLQRLPLAITAIGVAAAVGSTRMLNFASSVEENANKAAVVFGDNIDRVETELEALGDRVGRSRHELLAMASTLQDTFVPLGFARDAAADLSLQMTALAVDVGSFNNVASADVAEAFQSAIVGNHETVRAFGIVLTEATLKAEAYASGIAEAGAELTSAEKVQARLNIILKGTADAHGDAEKTLDGYANQVARLRGAFQDLIVELAGPNLERAADGVGAVADAVDSITDNLDVAIDKWQTFTGYLERARQIITFDFDGNRAEELTNSPLAQHLRVRDNLSASGLGDRRPGDGVAQGNLPGTGPSSSPGAGASSSFGFANDRGTRGSGRASLRAYARDAEAATEGTEALSAAQTTLGREAEEVRDRINEVATTLSSSLADAIVEGESLTDSFKGVFKSFVSDLIAEALRAQVIRGLLSFAPGLGLSGSLGGAFGTGGHGGERRGGGNVNANTPYLVGEEGPEIFAPPGTGRIIPNHAISGGSGGGVVVRQTVNVNTGVADTVKAEFNNLRPQMVADVMAALTEVLPRGGQLASVINRG